MSDPGPAPEAQPRLLLVEDSETSAALIARYLGGHYQVVNARDGEEAWTILSSDASIDLVITDIQMPRMNGHELLLKIRSSDISQIKNLPVIVMTTADNNTERDWAFASGANDFLVKPVDPIELQARVSVHQKLAQTIRELEASRVLLQEQATTDPLTKLKNRRAFSEIGARLFALSRRHGNDLSVVVLDIDHFKKVNDTHGHAAGDEALIGLAQILLLATRLEDTPARIGGEEFALLLPNTNRVGAAVLAERLRVAVEKTEFTIGGVKLSLTVSLGVAAFAVDGRDDLENLLHVADKRLYVAKENGRNRVVAR